MLDNITDSFLRIITLHQFNNSLQFVNSMETVFYNTWTTKILMILLYVLGYNCLMITVSEKGYHVKKITEPSIVILDLETTGLSKLLNSERKTLEFEKQITILHNWHLFFSLWRNNSSYNTNCGHEIQFEKTVFKIYLSRTFDFTYCREAYRYK